MHQLVLSIAADVVWSGQSGRSNLCILCISAHILENDHWKYDWLGILSIAWKTPNEDLESC